jgi:large subunit ribosomal protein L23
MRPLYEVIKKPLVSEKNLEGAKRFNKYVFQVASDATKYEIRQAVETAFNVNVLKVWTMMTHGEIKRTGRFEKKRPNWKKAIVKLKVGQKLDIYELGEEVSRGN